MTIPKVATYRVAVLDRTSGEVLAVLFVDAPTKTLAILNTRFEQPRTLGRPLMVTRLAGRYVQTAAGNEWHLGRARELARKARIARDQAHENHRALVRASQGYDCSGPCCDGTVTE